MTGNTMTFRNDGTASFQTSMGTVEIDKDGNMSGTLKDDKGNRLTMNADGTFDAETEQGDKIALTADGLKAKFSDGSFLNTDADGQITSAHCKIDDRTIDANTDDKGALHIKDDRGNSADINADGSGQMKEKTAAQSQGTQTEMPLPPMPKVPPGPLKATAPVLLPIQKAIALTLAKTGP